MVVHSRAVEPAPNLPVEKQAVPLLTQIQQLLNDGRTDAAVALLRQRLAIQQPQAEQLLEILLSGETRDVSRLFYNFEHGIYHA